MVSQNDQDAMTQAYLAQDPSSTYDVRLEPDLSPDPIVTVKTEPLPNFGLDPTLDNLDVRLIDYGSGEMLYSYLNMRSLGSNMMSYSGFR